MTKKKWFELDPALSHGTPPAVFDQPDLLKQSLVAWLDEAEHGDEIIIRCVRLTQKQIDNLCEI